MHAGRADASGDSGLGAQPLLLPDAHPDQRRAHPLEVRGPGVPARVDAPHPRPRRRRTTAEGGLALWLRLARGRRARPRGGDGSSARAARVRFACDAYVQFVRERSLLEAVASSLTEFFAPDIMAQRIAAWEQHYPWVDRAERSRTSERASARANATRGSARLRARPGARRTRAARALRRRARPQDRDPLGAPRLRADRVRPHRSRRRGARMIDSDSRPRLAPGTGCASIAIGGMSMILYPERGLGLNATAAAIVALATERATVREIIDSLQRGYGRGSQRDRARRAAFSALARTARGRARRRVFRGRRDSGRRHPAPLHADRRAHVPLPAALRLLLEPGRLERAAPRAHHRRVAACLRARPRRSASCSCTSPAASRCAQGSRGARRRGARDSGSTRTWSRAAFRCAASGCGHCDAPGSITCSCACRQPSAARPTRIAGCAVVRHKLEVARWVKALGLPLTINVVLHRGNIDEIDELVALAERLSADRLELANTQYLGWALATATRCCHPRAQTRARARGGDAALGIVWKAHGRALREARLFRGRRPSLHGRLGAALIVIAPDGRVLPCHGRAHHPTLQLRRRA